MVGFLQALFAQQGGKRLATQVSEVYVQEFYQVNVVFDNQYFLHNLFGKPMGFTLFFTKVERKRRAVCHLPDSWYQFAGLLLGISKQITMKPIISSLFFMLLFTLPAFAQKGEVFTNAQGALRGYDPVAYFKEGKPVEGKKEFTHTWNGAEWHFSSLQNKEDFVASPEKFAPQYGGYCAYGLSKGYKASTDPQAWTIVEDKLYLNYSKEVQQTWNKSQKEFIEKADKNWPEVAKKQ
jgi:YHS domain-containing protein